MLSASRSAICQKWNTPASLRRCSSFGRDAGDALQVVGLAARRLDAVEHGRLAGSALGRRRLGGADVDAGRGLAALQAVERRARHEIAVERDRAAGVVVARDREVDAVGIAVGVDDRHDRDAELLAPP